MLLPQQNAGDLAWKVLIANGLAPQAFHSVFPGTSSLAQVWDTPHALRSLMARVEPWCTPNNKRWEQQNMGKNSSTEGRRERRPSPASPPGRKSWRKTLKVTVALAKFHWFSWLQPYAQLWPNYMNHSSWPESNLTFISLALFGKVSSTRTTWSRFSLRKMSLFLKERIDKGC